MMMSIYGYPKSKV